MDLRRSPLVNGALYVLALTGCIVAQWRQVHLLEFICKPALMLVLGSWFYFNSRRVGDRFTLLIQAGLFFSLVGDVALMFQHLDEFNFILGLAAFLLAQLCYTLAFIQNIADAGGPQGVLLSSALSIPLLIYGFVFALDILPRLDNALVMPVMVYAGAITLMGIMAAFRFQRTFAFSFWLVFIGALLFIASDSLLATNRFVRPLPYGNTLIMLTYALAQVGIAWGALVHVHDPEQVRRRQELEA
ncbi:MAG: lysoplasmalogenase [Flavobacteriales bacterium]|nr:lysoplasmalogenase [Flavobacteriales bacterium]